MTLLFPNLTLLFILSILILCVGCENNKEDEYEPIQSVHILNNKVKNFGIIGGVKTTGWSGVVTVRSKGIENGIFCTGILIHPQVVLTAAHCVYFEGDDSSDFPSNVDIQIGDTILGHASAEASEIIYHPTWTGIFKKGRVDLALIKLNKTLNVDIYPMRDFPTAKFESTGKIVGFGDNGTFMGTKHEGDTTLLNVYSDLIQVGDPATICSGDSGGPLFTRQDARWVVTGVTSFAVPDPDNPDDNCSLDGTNLMVNTLAYCHWLNETMLYFVGTDLGLEECTSCKYDVVENWAMGCGSHLPDCPDGTWCWSNFPNHSNPEGYGVCAPQCCEYGTDSLYCFDVGSGLEKCKLNSIKEPLCLVHCEQDRDCGHYASCYSSTNKAAADYSICAGNPDLENTNYDIDTDTDTEGEIDAGDDIDTDDTNVSDANISNAGSAGCDCNISNSKNKIMLLEFFLTLLS